MDRILPTAIRALAVPTIALMAAACESPPPEIGLPGGVSFLQRDSAGVVVATTLGSRARSPSGWVVDTVPDYQVGESDGDEPYLFTTIAGARQLADGRVVVLDRPTCEWRFFGADGVFLERAGGTGDGPGEFVVRHGHAWCVPVPSPYPDSLFAWDGTRLSVFDDGGRFGRRQLLPWRGRTTSTVAGVADGVAVVSATRFHHPEVGDLSYPPEPVDYAMLEMETGRLVWEKTGIQKQRVYTVNVPGSIQAVMPMPFDIPPSVAMARGGLYMTLGENQGPEILQYGTGGHLSRIIRLAEPPAAPPTRQEIHRLIELYGELTLPEIKPVFSRLLVDDEGWLWAELYRSEDTAPVRWLVFDPNGEGVGSVDLPPDLDVRQIGRDFVLGVWEDELRVEYVRRHALTGRATGRHDTIGSGP